MVILNALIVSFTLVGITLNDDVNDNFIDYNGYDTLVNLGTDNPYDNYYHVVNEFHAESGHAIYNIADGSIDFDIDAQLSSVQTYHFTYTFGFEQTNQDEYTFNNSLKCVQTNVYISNIYFHVGTLNNYSLTFEMPILYSYNNSESNNYTSSTSRSGLDFNGEEQDTSFVIEFDLRFLPSDIAARYADTGNDDYMNGYNQGYTDGYTNGVSDGQSSGYSEGYQSGVDSVDTQSYYDQGFSNGELEGYDNGYQEGYSEGHGDGYGEGLRDGEEITGGNYTFSKLFMSIADVPIYILRNLLGFEVFGIQAFQILVSMIGGLLALFIIRKFVL